MPTDISTRTLIIGLKSTGKTLAKIAGLIDLSIRTINSIYGLAIKRGFEPNLRPLKIQDIHIADASRSSRPSKQTTEIRAKILSKVRFDRYGREKTYTDITSELSNISAITI